MGNTDTGPNFEVDQRTESDGVFSYTPKGNEGASGEDDASGAEPPVSAGGQRPNTGMLLAGFVFLAVASLVFGVATTLKNVSAPFQATAGKDSEEEELVIEQGPSIQDLKNQDTDSDGLSDYDEGQVYRTSPYLKDSDADGYDDKQEIATGHDPLCATGKPCSKEVKTSGATTDPEGSEQAGVTEPSNISGSSKFDPSKYVDASSQDPFAKLEQFGPAEVRALLLEKGLPPDKLQQLSDETIMELYRQTLEETKKSAGGVRDYTALGSGASVRGGSGVSGGTSVANPSAAVEPLALTPTQIRDLLRQSGRVTEQQLSELTDEQLVEIYRQALELQKKKSGQ
ncbi:MAG: hypothetical protein AAB416_02710 [Patescibacteria group bacterium]